MKQHRNLLPEEIARLQSNGCSAENWELVTVIIGLVRCWQASGFGVDGSAKEKQEDFEGVRGIFESNPFVMAVKEHIVVKQALGDELIKRLQGVKQ